MSILLIPLFYVLASSAFLLFIVGSCDFWKNLEQVYYQLSAFQPVNFSSRLLIVVFTRDLFSQG